MDLLQWSRSRARASDDATYGWLDAELRVWADNHQRLTVLAADSALLTEVIPISKALSDVADVGLTCLGALGTSQSITAEERKAHEAVLEFADVPMVEVTLPVIASIRALLEAVPHNAQLAPATGRKESS